MSPLWKIDDFEVSFYAYTRFLAFQLFVDLNLVMNNVTDRYNDLDIYKTDQYDTILSDWALDNCLYLQALGRLEKFIGLDCNVFSSHMLKAIEDIDQFEKQLDRKAQLEVNSLGVNVNPSVLDVVNEFILLMVKDYEEKLEDQDTK